MQIEQLEFIVSVAKYQSFSKTAEKLHISQSAISQSVKKLEDEFGIELFHRVRTGVIPTEKGKQIIEHAQGVLDKFSLLKDKISDLRFTEKRELKIGIVSGLYLPFLPTLLSELKSEFPELIISFTEKSSMEIAESIINKELDIGVIPIYENTLKKEEKIDFEVLMEIKMLVYMSNDSPLAQLHYVTPEHLANQTFVAFNGEFTNWYYENYIKRNGKIEVLFTSNNNETIREAIRKGIAITIDTGMELINNPFVKSGEIVSIPLVEPITVKTHFGFARLKNKTSLTQERVFTRLFTEHLNAIYKE
ncbi:LysR family transcriptional regulator [Bacillus sp. FJAT-29953]|nr:LysR family transcriptional regulator [Bacillus sp. FJAT-29953]